MSSYDQFARLYDLEHCDFRDDIELYLNMARQCRAPLGRTSVLDLGCGTGRVTLALVKAGFDVVGIDNSESMLDLAQMRVADAGLETNTSAGQVQLEHVDVRDMDSVDRFTLAIFSLNGFLHLATEPDQRAALHAIYRALLPGGFVIIDLPNPHTVFAPDADGQLYVRRRFSSEQGHPIMSLISTQTDLAEQIQHLALFYDEIDADGFVRRTAIGMELRFVYRYEMAGLLQQTGFEVDAAYGSYDLDLYEGDSPIMLFVAHKPNASLSSSI